MTESYSGFAFEVATPSINAPGGRLRRRLLVIAMTHQDAARIAASVLPGTQIEFKQSGSEVLAEALAAGVQKDSAKLL